MGPALPDGWGDRLRRPGDARQRHFAVDGSAPEPDLASRLGWREASLDELQGGADLVGINRLPTRAPTLGPSRRDAILGALGDEPPLEVRDGAEHVEDQLAGGRAGVDLILKAEERDAALLEQGHTGQQFGERSAQAIEAHNSQGVSFASIGQEFGQAGPIHGFAGPHVREHAPSEIEARSGRLRPRPAHPGVADRSCLLRGSTRPMRASR